MKKLVKSNGMEYLVESNFPLTLEQENEVIKKMNNGCINCGKTGNINSLATTGCGTVPVGTTKTLTANDLTTGNTYRWLITRDDGVTWGNTASSFGHQFTTVGTYTIALTVTNSCGSCTTENCTMTVVACPSMTATLSLSHTTIISGVDTPITCTSTAVGVGDHVPGYGNRNHKVQIKAPDTTLWFAYISDSGFTSTNPYVGAPTHSTLETLGTYYFRTVITDQCGIPQVVTSSEVPVECVAPCSLPTSCGFSVT